MPVRSGPTVHLVCDDSELTITIRDDGPRTRHRSVEPGHGITGMRELARILGGTLRTGPLPAGGYEVVAQLPLPDRRVTQRSPAANPL